MNSALIFGRQVLSPSVRRGGGSDIVVFGREAEEEVADAAAGEECLVAGLAEAAGDSQGGAVVSGVEVALHVPMIERWAVG